MQTVINKDTPWRSKSHWIVVLLVSFFFAFWNLSQTTVHPEDESLHISVMQQMLGNGHVLIPHDEFGPYFNKPPLKMWATLGLLKTFGESVFVYRVIDALLGVGTFIVTYLFALLILESSIIGIISVLFLGSAQIFLFDHGIRSAVQDSSLVFCSTICFLIGYLFLCGPNKESSRHERQIIYIIALCTAISLFTKSIAALIAPGLLLLFWIIFSRRQIPILTVAVAAILAVAPIVLYLLWIYEYHPEIFRIAFKKEILQRVTRGFQRRNQYLFYFEMIFGKGQAINGLSFFIALIYSIYRIKLKNYPLYLPYLLLWGLVPFILFSFLSTRLEWYILPALPAQALLCGWVTAELIKHSTRVLLAKGSLVLMMLGLAFSLFMTIDRILFIQPDIAIEKHAQTISQSPNGSRILSLEPLDVLMPSRFERVHLRMATEQNIIELSTPFEVIKKIKEVNPNFLLGTPEQISLLIRSGVVKSFVQLPPLIKYPKQHQRKNWLLIASLDSQILEGFIPVEYSVSELNLTQAFPLPDVTLAKLTGLRIFIELPLCAKFEGNPGIYVKKLGFAQSEFISCNFNSAVTYNLICRITNLEFTRLEPNVARLRTIGCPENTKLNAKITL